MFKIFLTDVKHRSRISSSLQLFIRAERRNPAPHILSSCVGEPSLQIRFISFDLQTSNGSFQQEEHLQKKVRDQGPSTVDMMKAHDAFSLPTE